MQDWTPTSIDALLTQTIDALYCGAIVLDRDGRLIHVNGRFCELVRRPLTDLIGRPFASLYEPGPDRERILANIDALRAGRESEFFLPRADGARVPVIYSGRILGDTPPCDAFTLVTIIDISRQKAAEESFANQYHEMAKLSDTILAQALDLKHYSERLEEKVRERTRQLHEANVDAIEMLAIASEAHDGDTGAHVRRIRSYATAVARRLGMSDAEAEHLGYSAVLHDVGKIAIGDTILRKPGPLTPDERATMQQHTLYGERILADRPFFTLARQIARSHHENWDGSGYPEGLTGEAIPPAARIVHVVDVFDALVQRRAYKEAWPASRAKQAISDGIGVMFEPRAAKALLEILRASREQSTRKAHKPATAPAGDD